MTPLAPRHTTDPASPHDPRLLLLAPCDNVLVAAATLPSGTRIRFNGAELAIASALPLGHKLAVRPIAKGEKILKYGVPIGSALRPIEAGEHVHTHNIKSDYIPTYTLDGQNPFLKGS